MNSADHYEGFERERKFHECLYLSLENCPTFKTKTLKQIIAEIAPDFLGGLFEIRPCVRKLRYTGCCNDGEVCAEEDDFFKLGKLYESIDFSGATYAIAGYGGGERRIGSSYFEWIKE